MKTALQEIRALKPAQVGGIKRIYESFGTGRDGIHRVARTFHISESAASTMATAVSTAPKPKPVTESAARPHGRSRRQRRPGGQQRPGSPRSSGRVPDRQAGRAGPGGGSEAPERMFASGTRGPRCRCWRGGGHVRLMSRVCTAAACGSPSVAPQCTPAVGDTSSHEARRPDGRHPWPGKALAGSRPPSGTSRSRSAIGGVRLFRHRSSVAGPQRRPVLWGDAGAPAGALLLMVELQQPSWR